MFFSAYLGSEDNAAAWESVLGEHAQWLGLVTDVRRGRLPDGRQFACGWILSPALGARPYIEATPEYILLNTWGDEPSQPHAFASHHAFKLALRRIETNVIKIGVEVRSGDITAVVPPASVEQLYLTCDARGVVFANDMRLLIRWSGFDPDERALCALLKYWEAPPPLTICRHIGRVPSGHAITVSRVGSGIMETRETLEYCATEILGARDAEPVSDPEQAVCATLDAILQRAPRSSVLFFSGGVDSSLLASRLPAIGRTDVRLVHYSFGPDDPESEQARRMADALGLRCDEVPFRPGAVETVLAHLGADYAHPFCDFSLVPTNLMLRAVLTTGAEQPGSLDGTGADAAFGLGVKYPDWLRLYRLPAMLRETLSGGYKTLGWWQQSGKGGIRGKLGHYGMLARRSIQAPLPVAAVVVKNALDGIAYRTPARVAQELDAVLARYLLPLGQDVLEDGDQLAILDLTHECAGAVASKSFDVLRRQDTKPIYPYLEPTMLRLALSLTLEQRCAGGMKKALLKQVLARRVPGELVYRKKSGFVPPFQTLLKLPVMQAYLHDVVLASSNPIARYLRRDVVGRMARQAVSRHPLTDEASIFLWALIASSAWIDQVRALDRGIRAGVGVHTAGGAGDGAR